jgi:hypothetical protein
MRKSLLHSCRCACYGLLSGFVAMTVAGEPWKSTLPAADDQPAAAKDTFDYSQPVMFQDSFNATQFRKWEFSVNFVNFKSDKTQARPEQVHIVDGPGLDAGRHAVRFAVQRGPDSFRSEICLPSEDGFQERWYGERILVPDEWVYDPNLAATIVMQWHALRGNWKPTFPNLAISISNTNWVIRQSFGSAQQPARTGKILSGIVDRGVWVSWVIHAKWSPSADGLLEIWKDGNMVYEYHGTNVYSNIGLAYTPYLKTGIYHPSWRMDQKNSTQKNDFFNEVNPATNKVVYVTDVKIGSERARFADVAPSKLAPKP